MKRASTDLLALACEKIRSLAVPAFIKDDALRYVAVNDAYARLFATMPAELQGRFSSPVGRGERDKAERLTIERDDAASVEISDMFGVPLGCAEIERFVTDDGNVYLFGQMPLPRSDSATPAPEEDLAAIRAHFDASSEPVRITAPDGRVLVENRAWRSRGEASVSAAKEWVHSADDALAMLDVGVAVFSPSQRLLYFNSQWKALYRPFVGDLRTGMQLSDFYCGLYDYALAHFPEEILASMPSRDAWIEERLVRFASPFSETTEQACDGRWVRSLNRRLENGMMLMLRLDVSDFKEQELQLRRHIEENELYQSIIEELPVAVYARGSDHKMVYVNQAFTTLFGHSRQNLIGHTEVESYGPGGVTMAENNDRVLQSGITSSVEERIDRPDESHFDAMVRTSRVNTENGDRYVIGSIVDITDLKLREDALRDAQARAESLSHDLSGILSALPAGVLVFDDHLVVEYVNQSLFEICGLPPSVTLPGEPVHHAIEAIYFNVEWQESEDGTLPEKLSLLFERGSEASLEFTTKTGRAVIAVSRNLTGGKTLVTFADISALREQEREITEARKTLENIGEFMQEAAGVMSQGLFVVRDGKIILSNRAAADILCVPPDLVQPGEHWGASFAYCAERGDFGSASEAEALKLQWRETLQKTGKLSMTFLAGGRSWVQFSTTVSDRGHIMVVINDMTEVKAREVELERLLARSEAADRAKSEFLGNMGQEIRTPINGVLGMAELLSKTDLDARQRTFTEIITKSANTLLTIFNDILDFSKIDSGRMELKPAPFDPSEAVEDVASLHSSAASEKNIDLLVKLEGAIPKRVLGDAGRFRQILANFVSNAIRHTEQGHVLIEMSAEAEVDGKVTLALRVEDTGIGMNAERLKSIFEKFSHGGTSEARHSEQTGLGLAITSGLVNLFGGTLEAQSAPGEGTSFTVRLPMRALETVDAKRPVPVTVQGARILVVDDNEVSRSILVNHLGNWGFDACAAESGEAAQLILDAAADLGVPVDAALVDYHMAGKGGAEFCRHIRADGRHDALALVLLTSLDAAADASTIDELQVQAHLTKPVRANILRNTVIEVLRARHARREAGDRLDTVNAFAARLPQLTLSLPDLPDSIVVEGAPPRVEILVAEDNEVNTIVFRQILEAAGHSFVIASNGEEAIALWKKHQPEVILMDVSMPIMDGLEATRRIRHMERVADLQPVAIIAVTAFDTDAGRELCLTHGMDDYIAKPISPEMLETKLAPWLGRAGGSKMPGE